MTSNPIDKDSLARDIGIDSLDALPRDVSPRHYFRGVKGGRNVIVMLYPEATDENMAEMNEFIRIGNWLEAQGIKAPSLYEPQNDKGYAVFEDLGQVSFGKYLRTHPEQQEMLYKLATDVLKKLYEAKPPEGLPLYKNSRIDESRRQIVDYYVAFQRGKNPEDSVLQGYLDAWQEIEDGLPPCPQGFVHGDYHLENLIYVQGEQGIRQCALIDYQGALSGPLPYDLVNLLEDARVDVPDELRTQMIDHYCEPMVSEEKEAFKKWYRLLGTQFHCRVIGLFIKLAAEQNRDEYLIHINRLQNYIQCELTSENDVSSK